MFGGFGFKGSEFIYTLQKDILSANQNIKKP